ncbi:hypothetical protein [Agromyces humi]|uniref:hypothetical protein n=1 Tax=Agromyces humi TaxID=1766800 RepID=UPI00135CAC9A|nr:hypothetical protein [Agromyces humi]
MTDQTPPPDEHVTYEPLGLPVAEKTTPKTRPWFAKPPFLIAAGATVAAVAVLASITFGSQAGNAPDPAEIAAADAARDADSCVGYLIEEVGGNTNFGTATGACIEWEEVYPSSWKHWLTGDDVAIPTSVIELAEKGYVKGEEVTLEETPAPAPAPAVAVITFYGSDIQILGSTYDDTPAVVDLGRVAGPYTIEVPTGIGFYYGAVSWNGANDAGCKVTVGDRVVIDNTGPNQVSANCIDYKGVH